jgi:CheY-like chemotaxis protein
MNVLNKILTGFGIIKEVANESPLRVFVLDDDVRRHEWFQRRFPRDLLHVVETVPEAIQVLESNYYDAIFLDHDLLPEHYYATVTDDERTGYAVARWLAANPQYQSSARITVHTRNADGAMRMVELLRSTGREADYVPFPLLAQRIKQSWQR